MYYSSISRRRRSTLDARRGARGGESGAASGVVVVLTDTRVRYTGTENKDLKTKQSCQSLTTDKPTH